jgi:hypothetical protein
LLADFFAVDDIDALAEALECCCGVHAGTQQLAEALKRYVTNTTGAYTLTNVTDSTQWTLTLEVSTRNPSSETQLSALGHAYVLARICADWYKNMGDTTREKEWLDQQVDAETRLKSAIYKKVAPVLTT